MQLELFREIDRQALTEAIFKAYYDCRKNKRNTINALQFEKHLERNLFELVDEIIEGNYFPGRSIAFIVNKPVKREVFAADFRDRVVHHYIINELNPLFESNFFENSFACRIDKGTHYGIRKIEEFVSDCSSRYKNDCYIIKLDIQDFFMHINRSLLFNFLKKFIEKKYTKNERWLILELCNKIIYNDPAQNCVIRGRSSDWDGLPKNKSLFHSPINCGLPIGNLTSQVFANFYLNIFDQFVIKKLGIVYYGRYVDDFVIIHHEKVFLQKLLPKLSSFLDRSLLLQIHPKKIYLQHYTKGVKFLGAVIKPYRTYIANRTKGNFYLAIKKQNLVIENREITKKELAHFLSVMNSYLGIMRHFKSYKIRKKILSNYLDKRWLKYVQVDNRCTKFIIC